MNQEENQLIMEEERGEIVNETWSLLPDVILNTVFTYLPRTDQVSASQVCRNWSRAMDNPNLWRKIDINLLDATLENLQKNLRITKRYGHHLRYLTITYQLNWDNDELERPLITLIDDIHGRAQLRSFKLANFELNRGNQESSILAQTFQNSVCRFLEGQHTLSVVIMTDHCATIHQGNQILQTIANGSESTLQTLVMENFFDPCLAVFNNATYLRIMDKFKHLEVVSCDYCCVSEEVLLCLAHNCAGRLRSLVITCEWVDFFFQTIVNDIWKEFKKECPNVLVDFQLVDIRDLETLKRLVPCQVPLRSLRYIYIKTALLEEVEALDVTNFIAHVLTNFNKTLEDLKLYCDDTVPNVGTILEEFLPSLKNLKRLVVTADISDTFVENVNAMREQKLINLSKFRPIKYDRVMEILYPGFLNFQDF